MKKPTDEELLRFLEGSLDESERESVLDALDRDPEAADRLRAAQAGLAALRAHVADDAAAGERAESGEPGGTRVASGGLRRVSAGWVAAAVAATLLVSVPTTLWFAGATAGTAAAPGPAAVPAGIPEESDPSFVLVLHGRWPDAGTLEPSEVQERAREYWQWTSSLARQGVLVAAGDLRWEPGERLGPAGATLQVDADELERADFIVGMFALRVDSYEEAVARARECPHLSYGGTVSVRRVGSGFVTVPGMGDWSD